jgi:hypothetical protein
MTDNTTRQTFLDVVFAAMFGFTDAQLFQIGDAAEHNTPKGSFT